MGDATETYRWGHPYDELMDPDCALHQDAPKGWDAAASDCEDFAETQAFVAGEFWDEVVSDGGGLSRDKKAEYAIGSLVYGVDACYWMLQAVYRSLS